MTYLAVPPHSFYSVKAMLMRHIVLKSFNTDVLFVSLPMMASLSSTMVVLCINLT